MNKSVAAHELVHWNLHRMYFYISQLLDDNYQLMNCSSKPIAFDDSISLKDRAYWYAEWQANELAIRVSMPKHLVEKAIEEYNNDESVHNPTDKPFSGMYYHHMIEKLSWDFNVPEVIVKECLRQLGYDYADGTFYTVDVSKYQPFTFTQGTLKENETFVIDRENYERLLWENKDFAELIESKACVYTGCVICLNDTKYVKPYWTGKNISFKLTDYGRDHADECCLILKACLKDISKISIPTTIACLCKLEDGNYSTIISDNLVLTEDGINDRKAHEKKKEEEKKVKKILAKMTVSDITTFQQALRFHMGERGIKASDMADGFYLKKDTLDGYLTDPSNEKKFRNPSLEAIMIICNILKLEYKLSKHLIDKAGKSLVEGNKKHDIYDYLLTITNASIEEWDLYLEAEGLTPFGSSVC